jgi:hypothetical protein
MPMTSKQWSQKQPRASAFKAVDLDVIMEEEEEEEVTEAEGGTNVVVDHTTDTANMMMKMMNIKLHIYTYYLFPVVSIISTLNKCHRIISS